MLQTILAKESLILSLLGFFGKGIKQMGGIRMEGKGLIEGIIDHCFQGSLLSQRLQRLKEAEELEVKQIQNTLDIINQSIERDLVSLSAIGEKYIQSISDIRGIAANVSEFLTSLKDPLRILKEEIPQPKLQYIESLFELLTLIARFCEDYDELMEETTKTLSVFQEIYVNGREGDGAWPEQNRLKYHLLLWVYQPLLRDMGGFEEKHAGLQKLKMAMR